MNSLLPSFQMHLFLVGLVLAALSPSATSAERSPTSESDVVVVVSRQNPVTSLTSEQIADIFLGRAQQFPNGQRAVPIDLSEGSTLREQFNVEVLGRTPAQVRTHWSRIVFTGRGRPPRSLASSAEVVQAVAADPHSIGYIEREFVDDTVTVVYE